MRWDRQAHREGGRDAGRGSLPGILQELGVSQRPWVDGGWGCQEAWRGGAGEDLGQGPPGRGSANLQWQQERVGWDKRRDFLRLKNVL